jgi:hypothetical protein
MSDEKIVSDINNAEDKPRIMEGASGGLPPAPEGYEYDENYKLQHVSQQLTRRTVSSMLEVAQGIFGGDRRERLAYRFYQSLFASGRRFAQ